MLLPQVLPGGVRLHLPLRTDLDGVRALCARHGRRVDAEALLRFDPQRRAVICATVLDETAGTVVGLGAIDLRPGAEPDLLIADDAELRGHLRAALLARVAGRTRRPQRRSRPRRVLRAVTRRRAA